jgi:hypothetical protein
MDDFQYLHTKHVADIQKLVGVFYCFNLFVISFIRHMCLMSVMTTLEFSRAEHSALFRRNSRNLRYHHSSG